jgi:hypothetical protein
MDSTFFHAYNSCDMDTSSIYGDSLEFYHDKGGLMTSKQGILMQQKKHLWQSNQRTGKGSIEVYSIKDYGAVEIGL